MEGLLTGGRDTPVLISVTVAYLPRNRRPEILGITVHPPGTVFQRPFSTGDPPIAGLDDDVAGRTRAAAEEALNSGPSVTLGRGAYRKGLQTFVWNATDPDDDELRFDVYYRREGGPEWRLLRPGLMNSIFTWDTTSVPDGTYELRIVGTDALSNPPDAALLGELDSGPIEVDNSPPRIDVAVPVLEGSRTVLPFLVRDDHSPITRVEVSLDAGRWQVIYPVDGIPDSRTEHFRLPLDRAEDAARLIIRATDAMNNAVTASGVP